MSASPTLSHDAPVHQPPDRLPWQEQQSPRLYSVGRPLPKNTIRFKCVDCGRPMEARAQDGGVDTNCPHCAAPLTVPRIPPNPYLRPIKNIVRQMKGVPLSIPLSATAHSNCSIDVGPRSVWRAICYHRRSDAGCRSLSRINPRQRRNICGRDRPSNAAGRRSASEFIRCSFFLSG